MKSLQEIEKLKNMCCTEAESGKQLRLDELSIQEKESQFTVNQLMAAQCEPVSLNTGKLADRANELERNAQNFAIPTLGLATKFSTWNPPSHAEGAHPQSCMFEQPRTQVSGMHFEKFADPSTFQCWKTSFKTEVCSCPGFLTDAVLWIKEAEVVKSVDDRRREQAIFFF